MIAVIAAMMVSGKRHSNRQNTAIAHLGRDGFPSPDGCKMSTATLSLEPTIGVCLPTEPIQIGCRLHIIVVYEIDDHPINQSWAFQLRGVAAIRNRNISIIG